MGSFVLLLLFASPAEPVDFDTEIVPLLTRSGCNAGECHGGALGRGGFRLSLLGGDTAFDHRSIVRELEGRRVNPARPRESLLFRKPTLLIEHGGDLRFGESSDAAALIERWISEGARRHRHRSFEHLDVTGRLEERGSAVSSGDDDQGSVPSGTVPKELVLERPGEIELRAVATFDDGVRRDVTRWTLFSAEDESAVTVDLPSSRARIERPGRHVVIARYLRAVEPLVITVAYGTLPEVARETPRHGYIDDRILARLETLGISLSARADDATFLRRARLALTGTLPALEETRAFLSDRSPRKRTELIDRLLATEDFTDYWTYRFAKLLRVRSIPGDREVPRVFHAWIRDQIESRTPLDELAEKLLTASGDSHARGEAGFYRMTSGPREHAEYASEVFLGARLGCANCHDHPLDRWTQDDYHGLAAVFARVERGRTVRLAERGEVTHPRTGEPARPRIPGVRFLEPGGDPRRDLARWLTDPRNPLLARATVNRLWKALMGRGLVEPPGDLRATNPPTHPELLDRLARDFVENGYDLRHTLRRIATSAAFARSAVPNERNSFDDRFYSSSIGRPLEPEVLADAVARVTGVPGSYDGFPRGTRALALPDPEVPSRSLDILGRCSRESSCEGAEADPGLATRLHILNGSFLNEKIASPRGRLARLLAAGRPAMEIVEELYLRALCRLPRAEEIGFWRGELDAAGPDGAKAVLEDFLWSLLASREFMTRW